MASRASSVGQTNRSPYREDSRGRLHASWRSVADLDFVSRIDLLYTDSGLGASVEMPARNLYKAPLHPAPNPGTAVIKPPEPLMRSLVH